MKVNIDSDEWYLVYELVTDQDDVYKDEAVEIPAAKVRQIQKVFREFQKVQEYLKKLEETAGT